jgi:hypothetical protein
MSARFVLVARALSLAGALAFVPAFALASSHSEAPGTAKDRLADTTPISTRSFRPTPRTRSRWSGCGCR